MTNDQAVGYRTMTETGIFSYAKQNFQCCQIKMIYNFRSDFQNSTAFFVEKIEKSKIFKSNTGYLNSRWKLEKSLRLCST